MTWDELFFNIIKEYKKKSKDPSSKFSAVIVDSNNAIVSSGFNGFPRGVVDSEERYNNREVKYRFVVHAEANAITNAARIGAKLDGCRIYVDTYPCSSCCKLIIQSGIREIVLNGDSELHNDEGFKRRWAEDIETTLTMCKESSVNIRIYKKD